MDSGLGALQREFLFAFFRRDHRFFLTGGGALVGFYLAHRETHDLDLFTLEDVLDEGAAEAKAVAREFGGQAESILTAPDFRRLLVRRGQEAILVDLVYDRVNQLFVDKPVIDGIRLDRPEEILANKLCTLLSRAEIRDLVDVRALEAAGYPVEHAVVNAAHKDGGFTPGQLSWVLRQIQIGDDLVPPGNVSAAELRRYLDDLIRRLTILAFPGK